VTNHSSRKARAIGFARNALVRDLELEVRRGNRIPTGYPKESIMEITDETSHEAVSPDATEASGKFHSIGNRNWSMARS